ncbi:hypothetical protein B1B_07894, partial [mine drainage metagenome]
MHGPYCQWSRKIDGKTISRWLSDEQLERYEGWFANARRVRDLLTELEALSLRIAERAEGWDPQGAADGTPISGRRGALTDRFCSAYGTNGDLPSAQRTTAQQLPRYQSLRPAERE